MKLICCRQDGTQETLELVGPIRTIKHPDGTMQILLDEGTGNDYWFDALTGHYDGFGRSVKADNLTSDEAKALLKSLAEMRKGD